jgi:hypothetical protein
MWPLLYRYNITRMKNPDKIEPEDILIVIKDAGLRETRDAVRKAKSRGDWRKWTDGDRKNWIENWVN